MIQIALPPLRERLEDMPLLVQHFVEKYRRELGKDVHGRLRAPRWSGSSRYPFPGNVRELENVIERAVALARGPCSTWTCCRAGARAHARGAARAGAAGQGANLDELLGELRARPAHRGARSARAA